MCGITGFWDFSHETRSDDCQAIITKMADSLLHRGPDDEGFWMDASVGIALGFRRLAILDLTPTGRQPMISEDGRFVIIFNGEVYNHVTLRTELQNYGQSFKGHSDTEVMLAAVCQWGVTEAVKRFNGMFAFALWDCKKHRLYLVRDRLGIKPLYYGWMGHVFLFGSELKSIKAHPDFQSEIDRDALTLFLRHNYIPTPYSIYRGVRKLPPGTILEITSSDLHQDISPSPYWSARSIVEGGVADPFCGTTQEAVDELDRLLSESVKQRMIADVPLGAFLSGGIDSSTIVALMQKQSDLPVRTFSIGFRESDFDEAPYAREISRHLGTEHTELYITPAEAREVIPELPALYDEPFSDSSQIPTFLVANLARKQVTVSLSGDGGDELFAGYNRYALGKRIWNWTGWMPGWMVGSIKGILELVSPETYQAGFQIMKPLIPARMRYPYLGEKIQKFTEILGCENPVSMYHALVSHWKDPSAVVIDSNEPATPLTDPAQWAQLPDFTRQMMYLDLITYLPDDILVKVDRASMGVSLEARVPFLDNHNVVEFAWRLPLPMKIRKGKTKWILRQVLHRYVPEKLFERPKMGFGLPIGSWLRNELRDWAESLLDERRLRTEGFFNSEAVREKWQEHLDVKSNWQYFLWDILMFQAWLADQG